MRAVKEIITCDSCKAEKKKVHTINIDERNIDICTDCLILFAKDNHVRKYLLRFVGITHPPSFGIADPDFD